MQFHTVTISILFLKTLLMVNFGNEVSNGNQVVAEKYRIPNNFFVRDSREISFRIDKIARKISLIGAKLA